jgi:hypothetical protein
METTMRIPRLLLILSALLAVTGQAQQVCPCVPLSHEWIVTACDSWNCAAAATVLANGSPDVIAMPSGSDDFKWLVLRRVVSGSVTVSPNEPFKLEMFPALSDAAARFAAVDGALKPMLFTAPDGNVVVVMRATAAPLRKPAVSR